MALSYVQYTGDGATTLFSVPFAFLSRLHVAFTVNGVAATFSWISDSQVQATVAPANGSIVEVRRTTPSTPAVTWSSGTGTRATDLNTEAKQCLYIAEEAMDDIDLLAAYVGSFSFPTGQNFLTYPSDLDNAIWTKNQSSVSANAVAAPDDTTTADKIVEDGTNNVHGITQAISTVIGSQEYTLVAYAKAAERTFVELRFDSGFHAIVPRAIFDLTNGYVTSTTGVNSATIVSVGDGWWRIAITATSKASPSSPNAQLMLCSSGTVDSYAGTGTSGAYFWYARVILGSAEFPLPISQGGTGSTNAAAARLALGGTVGAAVLAAADTAAARAAIPLDTIIVAGTYTVDLANVASGSRIDSADITATGAALGDDVKVWPPASEQTQGLMLLGRVVSANNIRILAFNPTAGGINLNSCDFRWQVFRKAT